MAGAPLPCVAPVPVLLDANALMMPFQFSVDLEDELRRLLGNPDVRVPSSALRELERLAQTQSQARAALRLAARYPVIEVEGRGDEAILAAARERGAVVVTNDRELRKRLRSADVPVIYLREKSRLAGEGLPLG